MVQRSSIVVSPVLDNGLHKVCTVDDWGDPIWCTGGGK